jgi:hypothetical protein
MTAPNRAYIEALLEGVPLPARPKDLADYARSEGDERLVALLGSLSKPRYGSLDEVGEEIQAVQPEWRQKRSRPRAESDLPPGGSEYGHRVREDDSKGTS